MSLPNHKTTHLNISDGCVLAAKTQKGSIKFQNLYRFICGIGINVCMGMGVVTVRS